MAFVQRSHNDLKSFLYQQINGQTTKVYKTTHDNCPLSKGEELVTLKAEGAKA